MVRHKVLFVDDELNTLSAFKRLFFNNDDVDIFTASNGAEGLKVMGLNNIDLVISDMRMPQLNGTDFLKYVKNKYPNVLRIMLTGYADMPSTLEAINNGEVYRFLTKPWNDDDLKVTITKALEYSDLKKRNEEMSKIIWKKNRDLTVFNENLEQKVDQRTSQLGQVITKLKQVNNILRQNFDEIINLLTGIISLFHKDLASHSKRVAGWAEALCNELVIEKDEKEIIIHAAFLHDIGMVGATDEIFMLDFEQLNEKSKNFFLYHPVIGERIIGAVKSLRKISKIIRSHHEEYNGNGFPDQLRGAHIPIGAQIIKIASDYDTFRFKRGLGFDDALKKIKDGSYKSYDPDIITSFIKIITKSSAQKHNLLARIKIKDLKPNMYLLDEITLENGVLLIPKGVIINDIILKKIYTFSSLIQLNREVEVKYLREH